MKVKLGEKIITQFAALRPQLFSYLTDKYDRKKKAQKVKFEDLNIVQNPYYIYEL